VIAIFLVFELSGAFIKRAPWRTASETVWDLEDDHPWRASAIFGFLVGLALHMKQRLSFGRAETGGVFMAWIARLLWSE
jgi:hypothetical protein